MDNIKAASLFEALSSDQRLGIFRLLAQNDPDGLVAGDISRMLEVAPSNLSFHLKTLLHCGLVSLEKEGRFMRYRANEQLVTELTGFLSKECSKDDNARSSYRNTRRGQKGGFPSWLD